MRKIFVLLQPEVLYKRVFIQQKKRYDEIKSMAKASPDTYLIGTVRGW